MGRRDLSTTPLLVAGAIFCLCWAAATYVIYVLGDPWTPLPEYFCKHQDLPVLVGYGLALLALTLWFGGRETAGPPVHVRAWPVVLSIIAAVLIARIGREVVFHGYSASRDEVMAEMAGAYMAAGHIGWPIPVEWQAYGSAIVPEFASPYGVEHFWSSIYLPVHAAIRALFLRLGDADAAAPITLGIGLIALWDIARRLFPDRPDARLVVMVMALTSAQLLATAMTPFAMTSHFALDMVWLALILRGGVIANLCAGLVLVAAIGVHQWHFPLIFVSPFILWLAVRRQWLSAAIQVAAVCIGVILWAKLWPLFLARELGPALAGPVAATPGIGAKLMSMLDRFDTKWQPMFNIARFSAWNNVLLMPLAVLGTWRLARAGRDWLRDVPIIAPLALTVLAGLILTFFQGYGWGFRYMHGQIASLCLLAGFGWTSISREGRRPMGLIWAGSAISLIATAYLLSSTELYVRGYARVTDAIHHAPVDVVLVDVRGGYYMNDLVRFDRGTPGRPAVMAITELRQRDLPALCHAHSVALIGQDDYWRLGVHPVRLDGPLFARIDAMEQWLGRSGCLQPVNWQR